VLLVTLSNVLLSASDTANIITPILMDLDGNHQVNVTSMAASNVLFDVNSDNVLDKLAWVASGDGVLAYDFNHDGLVTDVKEFAFSRYVAGAVTDMEGLRAFDSNNDGKLDAMDHDFDSFVVWQDKNSNGVSDSGEVTGLNQSGIASINLATDNQIHQDGDAVIFGEGSFTYSNGETGMLADAGLRFEAAQSLIDTSRFDPSSLIDNSLPAPVNTMEPNTVDWIGQVLEGGDSSALMTDLLSTDNNPIADTVAGLFEPLQVAAPAELGGGVDGAVGAPVSTLLNDLLTQDDMSH
jgi:hypothetical protein